MACQAIIVQCIKISLIEYEIGYLMPIRQLNCTRCFWLRPPIFLQLCDNVMNY